MAPHSSTLAWKIPRTEEPGRLRSMGSRRVRHEWAISLSLFTFMHWRRKWQPTPVFLPGESQGQGSLVGCRLRGHTESVGHDWSDLAAGGYSYCRPDVGYVRGMSFIMVVFILSLEAVDAFIGNLMCKSFQLAFFCVDCSQMLIYFGTFEVFFEGSLLTLFLHIK